MRTNDFLGPKEPNRTPEKYPNRAAEHLVEPPTPPVDDISAEIGSDDIEIIAHIPTPSTVCEGFIFPLAEGRTFANAYPVLLHDQLNLSWDFGVRREVLYLTAHACTRQARRGERTCKPCSDLGANSTLQGIIARSQTGVHENTSLKYQPPAALVELVHRKNTQIQSLWLGVLTSSRNLLTQAASMSDYKRFVVAIGSGEVRRVDRVVGACIKQKRGIRGMFDTYLRAAKGVYNPANSEEEDMVGLTIWKLAGFRVAEIAHRALGLPGVTTLRNRMITPPLTVSPGAPQVGEIEKNIDAVFTGITDAIIGRKVVHLVVMFDEIATEKRIRWDPRTNFFLGICREHAHRVGLEFNGEGDLDELFAALEKQLDERGKMDARVHIAGEATVGAVGIMSEDSRLYSARPILISGDCNRESGEKHAQNVLEPVMEALERKKELTHLRTICLASDGETRRGSAFMIKTWKRRLPERSNIYQLLTALYLKFMNLMVGDDDLTADKDPKHVDKCLRNSIIRTSYHPP
ncbi:hypothetical protein B0H19DRAFT_949797 [Mycena capillaripes]|nr:hypothetical protein B0H19DRAFT_949797 [Mycena capillaripes]